MEKVIELLKLIAEFDCHEGIWWAENKENKIEFLVHCNDLFFWGCADAEEIQTDEDVDLLRQCLELDKKHGTLLYCAKRRSMRPQGAYYKYFSDTAKLEFDKCGPERETGFGNPRSQNNP